MTPAAISHQVRHLEEQLGIPLFERRHRSVVLTERGARLADSLHSIFSDLEQALERAVEPLTHKIRISSLPSFAAKWLAPRIHGFERRHPLIRLRIDTSDHLVRFGSEPVDVGLRYGAGEYPGLHVECLMTAPVFPVCSPSLLNLADRPLRTANDLESQTLLHDDTAVRASGIPNWAAWLRAALADQVSAERGPVFGSIFLALEAAIAGHGVALGVGPLVEDDIRNGRLARPFALELPNAYSFWIVCEPKKLHDVAIHAFISWLHEEAAAVSPRRSA